MFGKFSVIGVGNRSEVMHTRKQTFSGSEMHDHRQFEGLAKCIKYFILEGSKMWRR
jgi:hypothetical protein